MQELLEDEMKRVRIKEKSEQLRHLVKTEQADLISCKLYPNFEPGVKNHCDGQAEREQRLIQSLNATAVQNQQNSGRASPAVGTRTPTLEKTVIKPLGNQQLQPANIAMTKKSKPAWAMTSEQKQEVDDAEIDGLLDFMEHFDADKYAQDVEVREMIATLKNRVGEIKKEVNWKEEWETRLKEKRRKREMEYNREKAEKSQIDDDMIPMNGDASQLGVAGGSIGSRGEAKTVLSERSQGNFISKLESIKSIKEKMDLQSQGKSEWDKSVDVL